MYLQQFPGLGGKRQVSTAGGGYPYWRGDGRELYFIAEDQHLMAVSIDPRGGPTPTAPKILFATRTPSLLAVRNVMAVTPDGQRFLILTATGDHAATADVVVNWQTGLSR